ncbi:hypothetical protein PO124_10145 [Bacillus licheniformis]|nr:hypothetical protein [Bacillus licheniformis]
MPIRAGTAASMISCRNCADNRAQNLNADYQDTLDASLTIAKAVGKESAMEKNWLNINKAG